ncbi:MAG: hypothetical protein VR75_05535 [Hyphomonadaceae bacterium BRH_c29]|nr:MAG: hypothetical protein VR75_05535 [Hyphomonadaceae bacterium BRH_c29]
MSASAASLSEALDLIFDHVESTDWYWGDAADEIELALRPNEPQSFKVIETALNQLPSLMARYSAWQIATGFEFLFNNVLSSYPLLFQDERIEETRRVLAAENLFDLFNVFFRDATTWTAPVHLQRTAASDRDQGYINTVCYMFWDNCPLVDFGIPSLRTACIKVMERCLSVPSNAVIESALHGLGHLAPKDPRAVDLSSGFAARGIGHPALIAYAKAASAGRVP